MNRPTGKPRYFAGKRYSKKPPKSFKKYVSKAISTSQELKHKQTVSASVGCSTTISLTNISTISQGDGSSERIGLTIKPTSINGMLRVVRDAGATANSYMKYRILLVQWHMNSADEAPDAIGDFMYETATNACFSHVHVKKSLRDKFTVLWDSNGQVLGTRETGSEGVPSVRIHRFNILKKMQPIGYNSNATTGTHNIYLVIFGDQSAGVEDGVVDYSILVRYKDKP